MNNAIEAMHDVVDKRRFQRVNVNLLGRFMLADQTEYPCQVSDMSPGGAALVTSIPAQMGDRVIAYVDHIGRIEGQVTVIQDGGFAISINASERKREKLSEKLTWIINRSEFSSLEDRRHERLVPESPDSHITLPDGRVYNCQVIDMSISGAAVAIAVKPAIGTIVTFGKMRGRVVRHIDNGIALEFIDTQKAEALADHFGLR